LLREFGKQGLLESDFAELIDFLKKLPDRSALMNFIQETKQLSDGKISPPPQCAWSSCFYSANCFV